MAEYYNPGYKSPFAAITEGLKVASDIYGIKQARDAHDNLIAKQKKEDDASALAKGLAPETDVASLNLGDKVNTKGFTNQQVADARKVQLEEGIKASLRPPKEVDPNTAAIKEQNLILSGLRIDELRNKRDETVRLKTPAGRLEKLGAEAKAKVGGIASTLDSINQYNSLIDEGFSKSYIDANTPIIGGVLQGTPVSEATTKLSDDIGRLRSGGAINKDEESRFLKMLPTGADDPTTSKRKLSSLAAEMKSRLGAYGFQDEQLGEAGIPRSQVVKYKKDKTPGVVNLDSLNSMSDEQLAALHQSLKKPALGQR